MYKVNISEFTYSDKCLPLNILFRVQFRYFYTIVIAQNIFGMSSNGLLVARILYSGSSTEACLFVLTNLIFEIRKRAFRIKFGG